MKKLRGRADTEKRSPRLRHTRTRSDRKNSPPRFQCMLFSSGSYFRFANTTKGTDVQTQYSWSRFAHQILGGIHDTLLQCADHRPLWLIYSYGLLPGRPPRYLCQMCVPIRHVAWSFRGVYLSSVCFSKQTVVSSEGAEACEDACVSVALPCRPFAATLQILTQQTIFHLSSF